MAPGADQKLETRIALAENEVKNLKDSVDLLRAELRDFITHKFDPHDKHDTEVAAEIRQSQAKIEQAVAVQKPWLAILDHIIRFIIAGCIGYIAWKASKG